MKKIIIFLVISTIFCSHILAQNNIVEQEFDFKIEKLEKEMESLQNNYNNTELQYNRAIKIIEDNNIVDSSVSNLLALLAIIITIITIFIPILNYFLVLRPQKNMEKRIENVEFKIIEKIENEFENYIKDYEDKKMDIAIDKFVEESNADTLLDYLILSPDVRLNEEKYRKIINKIKELDDIDESTLAQLNISLMNHNSKACDEYFRTILEDEGSKSIDDAIAYFVKDDIIKRINYIEKILISRDDFSMLLIKLFNRIYDEYLGDPFIKKKSKKDYEIGKNKIEIILNNEKIVNNFDINDVDDLWMMNTAFLENPNIINWHPFLKDTKLYKRHYEE